MQIRVYYEDTDAAGVVYHSNYLNFLERARTEWVRSLGIEQCRLAKEHQLGFVVSKMSIDFKRPARLDDLLTISTEVVAIKGASMIVNQEIYHQDMCLIQANVRIGFIRLDTMKPTAFPLWIKEQLTRG